MLTSIPLTRRELKRRFAAEYVIDLNASAAAVRAGYAESGARMAASRCLRDSAVRAEIDRLISERSRRTSITADAVLSELHRLAFADVRKLFDEEGRLRPVHELPDDVAAAIASIEVGTARRPGGESEDVEYTSKIKLWDKRSSLELLAKHLRLLGESNVKLQADGLQIEITL